MSRNLPLTILSIVWASSGWCWVYTFSTPLRPRAMLRALMNKSRLPNKSPVRLSNPACFRSVFTSWTNKHTNKQTTRSIFHFRKTYAGFKRTYGRFVRKYPCFVLAGFCCKPTYELLHRLRTLPFEPQGIQHYQSHSINVGRFFIVQHIRHCLCTNELERHWTEYKLFPISNSRYCRNVTRSWIVFSNPCQLHWN